MWWWAAWRYGREINATLKGTGVGHNDFIGSEPLARLVEWLSYIFEVISVVIFGFVTYAVVVLLFSLRSRSIPSSVFE